jgi:ribosomal protein S14
MKNKKQIDNKRRQLFKINELNNKILKVLAYNTNLSILIRWKYLIKLTKLHKNSYSSKIHNFCILTGRPKSIFKNFKMSRISFRTQSSFNKIVGVNKKSW